MSEEVTNRTYDTIRSFSLDEMGESPTGREWIDRLQVHAPEMLSLFNAQSDVRNQSTEVMRLVAELLASKDAVLDKKALTMLMELLNTLAEYGSEEFRSFADDASGKLRNAEGRTVREVFGIR